jgi:hypothetical protein
VTLQTPSNKTTTSNKNTTKSPAINCTGTPNPILEMYGIQLTYRGLPDCDTDSALPVIRSEMEAQGISPAVRDPRYKLSFLTSFQPTSGGGP